MDKRRSSRRGGAPTVVDVARLAGVSAMTVSRVMRLGANVGAAKRAAVLAAVDELGYRPNVAARQLATAARIRIGVPFSNPSASYLTEFLKGGLEQASDTGFQLELVKCEADDHAGDLVRGMLAGRVDGLVLPPPLCDDPHVLEAVRAGGRPAVAVGTSRPPVDLSVVAIDDRVAAADMTRHLLALGHRRIGFIGGDANQTVAGERLAGYRDALAAAGVRPDPALAVPGLFTYRSGLDAAERLLALRPAPTAVFASNDDMAAAAVASAHRLGLDVPGDLTVCGFDDSFIATVIWPTLTTIRQPIDEMARTAFEVVTRMVREERLGAPRSCVRVELAHTLVRRGSDGSPRARSRARATADRRTRA